MSTSLPTFIALAACDPAGVIGKNRTLPWHCSDDLQHFRSTTLGQVMIMGYNTYLSMPAKAFEHRTSLVFTRSHTVDRQLAMPVGSLEEFEEIYTNHPSFLDRANFVIGGEAIFNLFFESSLIERALITHLHESYSGDTYFPLQYLHEGSSKIVREHQEFSIVEYVFKKKSRGKELTARNKLASY